MAKGKAYLSKSDILGIVDLKIIEIEVPEWGGTIRIKSLTGAERDALESTQLKLRETGGHLVNFHARLAAACIVDEDGSRLFTDGDIAVLGQKNANVLDRICTIGGKLCGLMEGDIAELAKNSKSDQSEGSTSN